MKDFLEAFHLDFWFFFSRRFQCLKAFNLRALLTAIVLPASSLSEKLREKLIFLLAVSIQHKVDTKNSRFLFRKVFISSNFKFQLLKLSTSNLTRWAFQNFLKQSRAKTRILISCRLCCDVSTSKSIQLLRICPQIGNFYCGGKRKIISHEQEFQQKNNSKEHETAWNFLHWIVFRDRQKFVLFSSHHFQIIKTTGECQLCSKLNKCGQLKSFAMRSKARSDLERKGQKRTHLMTSEGWRHKASASFCDDVMWAFIQRNIFKLTQKTTSIYPLVSSSRIEAYQTHVIDNSIIRVETISMAALLRWIDLTSNKKSLVSRWSSINPKLIPQWLSEDEIVPI